MSLPTHKHTHIHLLPLQSGFDYESCSCPPALRMQTTHNSFLVRDHSFGRARARKSYIKKFTVRRSQFTSPPLFLLFVLVYPFPFFSTAPKVPVWYTTNADQIHAAQSRHNHGGEIAKSRAAPSTFGHCQLALASESWKGDSQKLPPSPLSHLS